MVMTLEKPTLPASLTLGGGSRLELKADGPDGSRRLDIVAYSGAEVKQFGRRLILDLEGVDLGKPAKPILRDHNPGKVVGHSDSVKLEGGKVRVRGVVSRSTEYGREVADLSDEGFPWQASVGIDIDRAERLEDGDSKTVNGRTFSGPGDVVTKWRLKEVSVVPLGADTETFAIILSADVRGTLCLAAGDERLGIIDAAAREFAADASLQKITSCRAMVNLRLADLGHARMPDAVFDAIGLPTTDHSGFVRDSQRYGGSPTRSQVVGRAQVEFRQIHRGLSRWTSEQAFINCALHDMSFRRLTPDDVRTFSVRREGVCV